MCPDRLATMGTWSGGNPSLERVPSRCSRRSATRIGVPGVDTMFRLASIGALMLLLLPGTTRTDDTAKTARTVRILLLGDSTCIGSVCRTVAPQADHLEQVIEKL